MDWLVKLIIMQVYPTVIASSGSRGNASNPKLAALQGLKKMKALADLGIPQAYSYLTKNRTFRSSCSRFFGFRIAGFRKLPKSDERSCPGIRGRPNVGCECSYGVAVSRYFRWKSTSQPLISRLISTESRASQTSRILKSIFNALVFNIMRHCRSTFHLVTKGLQIT